MVVCYWEEVKREENEEDLIKNLNINNIESFLKNTQNFIRKSGNKYIKKLSRVFL